MLSWFVVETKSIHERLAESRIKDQGFEVFLPVADGRCLYPRYLFARFDLRQRGWQSIWNTRGVLCILGSPTPVDDAIIAEIREFVGIAVRPAPVVGDRVTIRDGMWRGQVGLLSSDEGERVRVLLSLFGKDFPVTVDKRKIDHG